MLLFWKLVNETQMSKPLEATRHHDCRKLLILLPLSVIYFNTLQYETPCICKLLRSENTEELYPSSIFHDNVQDCSLLFLSRVNLTLSRTLWWLIFIVTCGSKAFKKYTYLIPWQRKYQIIKSIWKTKTTLQLNCIPLTSVNKCVMLKKEKRHKNIFTRKHNHNLKKN